MAPKRPSPIAHPPTDSDFSTDDESQETHTMKEDQAPAHDEEISNAESEDEENNAEDTISSPTDSNSTPKPTWNPAVPASKSAAKRPLFESEKNEDGSQKKKKKMKERSKGVLSGNEERAVEEKKSANRVWCEEDEIVILNGIVKYQSKKGVDPSTDIGGFLEFIKKSLKAAVVTEAQLKDKVRRLKQKFQAKKGEKGKDPVFSKPHENETFQLSKKIWGGGTSAAEADFLERRNRVGTRMCSSGPLPEDRGQVLAEPEDSKCKRMNLDKEDFWSMYPCFLASLDFEKSPFPSLSEAEKNFVKERMTMIGGVKAKEMEDKWKKLRMEEFALNLKRLELVQQQTKLMMDAMNGS